MEPKGGPRVQNGAEGRGKGAKMEPRGAKRRPKCIQKSISEGGRENDVKIGRPGITFWDVFWSKSHLKSGKKRTKTPPKKHPKINVEKVRKNNKKHVKIRSKINETSMKFLVGGFYEDRVFAWTVCLE